MRVIHSQPITDEAQVGTVRRAVNRFAKQTGLEETAIAQLDIVVQELATNAVKYAENRGWLHWTEPLAYDGRTGVELFYCDKGPGISDLERAFRDGVSSGGGLGTGLGAVRRLTEEFDAYSTVQGMTRRLPGSRRSTHGTAILVRKWAPTPHSNLESTAFNRQIGAWTRARPGEDTNGDAYFITENCDKSLYAVIDGLGHGSGAKEASDVALEVLSTWAGEPLDDVIVGVHDALRATRGAVMSAVVLDRNQELLQFAGVGNIEVRILGGAEPARPIPTNGTLGARLSQLRVWPHRWTEGMNIIMASDGVSASWDIESYPGLLVKSPQLVAGILLRDYGRDTDDATVLVVR
jgi:anti-sigma regulatory factor (Ser/Thr protein kinase)